MSSNRYHKHFTVSWDQLHRDVRELCHQLVERDFKGIVAITRGGLIPAALIARELNVRLIDTVCIRPNLCWTRGCWMAWTLMGGTSSLFGAAGDDTDLGRMDPAGKLTAILPASRLEV